MKPYYDEDGITIYHGDCREIIYSIPIDYTVLLTDPPYGISGGRGGDSRNYQKGNYRAEFNDTEEYIGEQVIPVVRKLLATSRRAAITPGIRCLHLYPRPLDMGCFWTPASITHGPWGFTCFQPILYYGTDFRAGVGAWPSGKQVTEPAVKNGHPCPKPLSAWTWLLEKIAEQEDVVLDPFAGSGTTLEAAKRSSRRAIGIEIEESYCEISAKRLSQRELFQSA